MARDQLRLVGDDQRDPTPTCAIAARGSAEQIAEMIRSGLCPDDACFDQFLPYELRLVSAQHWTPVVVALRVAEWLDDAGVREVVDVGSGAGKLCVAAALASRCSFIGIEQRPRLVLAARALAARFRVEDRVHFIESTLGHDTIPDARAYYLYNPFGENLFENDPDLGADVELSYERYQHDVALMEDVFERAPAGTIVIKYNGFGGRMPASYQQLRVDWAMPTVLRMWRKQERPEGPAHGEAP
jgi:SAM-dependent methyltransferase